jgi:hypothetical protein
MTTTDVSFLQVAPQYRRHDGSGDADSLSPTHQEPVAVRGQLEESSGASGSYSTGIYLSFVMWIG